MIRKKEKWMRNILLLTKSLFNERKIEQQLQQLDCEVYVSKKLLENCLFEEADMVFIGGFDIVLLSETISNNEMVSLLPKLKFADVYIVRKSDLSLSEDEKNDWKKQGIVSWVKTESDLEELRESIDYAISMKNSSIIHSNILKLKRPVKRKSIHSIALTPKERSLINLLYHAKGSVISRDTLSLKLWDQPSSNSTMTQLSTMTHRLRGKFKEQGIIGETIQTVWGLGYKLSEGFFDQVDFDENYLKEM